MYFAHLEIRYLDKSHINSQYFIQFFSISAHFQDSASDNKFNEHDNAYNIFDFKRQNGRKDFPYIVMVNSDNSERNSIFCITRFVDKEINNFKYNGYHIRLSIDLPDYDAYEMFFPDYNEFPMLRELHGRAVIVKGPSRSYWFRGIEKYYRQDKITCQNTRDAHEKHDSAVVDNPIREF